MPLAFVRNFQLFLLVLVRLLGMMVVAPFFSSLAIPFRMKALLAFFTSIILYPMVAGLGMQPSLEALPYILEITGQLLVGVLIGFLVGLFFVAFQFAGQLFSVQMGLSISMVFDPQHQIQLPILGQMLSFFGVLLFLSVDAHHQLLSSVFLSFKSVPFFSVADNAARIAKGAGVAFIKMFGAAIRIALPMIATAMLISVTLGILAKTSPQLNVLMLGFPIQIGAGFIVIYFAVPLLFRFMSGWIKEGIQFTMKLVGG